MIGRTFQCFAFFVVLLFLNSRANAQNVAVFYPKANIQQDFLCMTEAVFKTAASNGVGLSWTVFDTENDTSGVVRAAAALKNGKFTHILGTRTSQEAIVLAKIAENLKIPFIAPIASHPEVTKEKKYSIRMVSTSARYGRLMREFLQQRFVNEKVAILKNTSLPFSTFYADFMSKSSSQRSNVTQTRTFETFDGFKDYDTVAQQIVRDGFKVVYAPVYTVEAVSLYNALGKAGFSGSVVSQGGITDGKEFFEKGASENDRVKVLYNGIWSGNLEGPMAQEYVSLKKKYCPGQPDSIRSISAFDSAKFLLDVTMEPKLLPEEFVRGAKKKTFAGLMGALIWGADGEPVRPLHMFELQKVGAKYVGAFE